MKNFTKNESSSNSNFIHVYSGITKAEMDEKVHKLLISSGYQKIEGVKGDGTYTKGNRVLRILLGAFIKYFKFKIKSIAYEPDEVKVQVYKESSGMSGGLIGMNQVKNELNRLSDSFKTI